VMSALKERQDAYDAAAKLADVKAIAKGGNKQEADRLRAAIAAIPRIEIVLARISAILAAARPPDFNERAGLAYAVGATNGAVDTDALLATIGMIQGYKTRFGTEKATWDARLKSAKAIAGKLNIPGT